MSGRSSLAASAEQQAALRELAGSAVRAVASDGMCLDPAIASKAVATPTARPVGADPAQAGSLSEREEGVLRLAAQGFSNGKAAAWLGISTKTVETYRARAADKLDLRTRADIVRYGVTKGWLGAASGPE